MLESKEKAPNKKNLKINYPKSSRRNFKKKGVRQAPEEVADDEEQPPARKNSYLDRFNKKMSKGVDKPVSSKRSTKEIEKRKKSKKSSNANTNVYVKRPSKIKKPIDLNEESLREIIKPPERITDLIRSEYEDIIETHNVIFSSKLSRKNKDPTPVRQNLNVSTKKAEPAEEPKRKFERFKGVDLEPEEEYENEQLNDYNNFDSYVPSPKIEEKKDTIDPMSLLSEKIKKKQEEYDFDYKNAFEEGSRKGFQKFDAPKKKKKKPKSDGIEIRDAEMEKSDVQEISFSKDESANMKESEVINRDIDVVEENKEPKPQPPPKVEIEESDEDDFAPLEPLISFSNIIVSNQALFEKAKENQVQPQQLDKEPENPNELSNMTDEEELVFEVKKEAYESDRYANRMESERQEEETGYGVQESGDFNEFMMNKFAKTMGSEENMFGDVDYRKKPVRRQRNEVMDSTDMVNAMKRNSSKDIAGFNSEESDEDTGNVFESKVRKQSVRFDDDPDMKEYQTNTFNYEVTQVSEKEMLESIKNLIESGIKRENGSESFRHKPLQIPDIEEEEKKSESKDESVVSEKSVDKREERMKRVITFANVHKVNNNHTERDEELKNYYANQGEKEGVKQENHFDRSIDSLDPPKDPNKLPEKHRDDHIKNSPPNVGPKYQSAQNPKTERRKQFVEEITEKVDILELKRQDEDKGVDFSSWEQNLDHKTPEQVDLHIIQEINDIYRDTNLSKSTGRSSNFSNPRMSDLPNFTYNFFEENDKKMNTILENDEEDASDASSENLDKFTLNELGKTNHKQKELPQQVSDSIDIRVNEAELARNKVPKDYQTQKPSSRRNKAIEDKNAVVDDMAVKKDVSDKPKLKKTKISKKEPKTQKQVKPEPVKKKRLTEEEFDEKFNELIIKMLNKKAVLIQRFWRSFSANKKKAVNITDLFKEFLMIKRRNENFVRKNHKLRDVQTNPYSIKIIEKEFHELLDEKQAYTGVSDSLNKIIGEVNFVTEKLRIFSDAS